MFNFNFNLNDAKNKSEKKLLELFKVAVKMGYPPELLMEGINAGEKKTLKEMENHLLEIECTMHEPKEKKVKLLQELFNVYMENKKNTKNTIQLNKYNNLNMHMLNIVLVEFYSLVLDYVCVTKESSEKLKHEVKQYFELV